jgi:hypothetical protein
MNLRGKDATPEPPHNNRVEASFLLEVEVLQGITLVPMIVDGPYLVKKVEMRGSINRERTQNFQILKQI